MTDTVRYMTMRGLAQTAELRTATFDGREHLVVPVIAMVGDSIVWPMNAETPELVPAETLRRAPIGWDGRPVVPEHPMGGNGSANQPGTLERMRFGQLFNTKFSDGKLKTEAWIDVERAKRLGGDPLRVLERVRAGELVEVSIGAWVTGQLHDGEEFGFIWTEIVPDHLAMLPEGHTGACSVEMGCGAPRIARRREVNEVASQRQEVVIMKEKEKPGGTLLSKAMAGFFQFMGSIVRQAQEGMSDSELRDLLWSALRNDVPAFEGIVDVFPDDGIVIYVTTADGDFTWWSRGFRMSEGGDVTLRDNAQEVRPETEFRPVSAEGDEPEPKADSGHEPGKVEPAAAVSGDHDPACGCTGECTCAEGDKKEPAAEPAKDKKDSAAKAAAVKTGGGKPATMTGRKAKEAHMSVNAAVKALVAGLITNDRTPFTGDQEETLLALPEDQLKTMESKFNEEPYIEPEPEPEPKPPTREEWLAMAPPDVRSLVEDAQERDNERRTLLINSLVRVQPQGGYTRKQLEAKPTKELETLCEMLKIHAPRKDYSGRGLVAGYPADDADVPEPPNMGKYLRAKQAGKTADEAMREARN